MNLKNRLQINTSPVNVFMFPIKLYGFYPYSVSHKHFRVVCLPEKGYFWCSKTEVNETDKNNHNKIKVVNYSDEKGFEFGFVCGLCEYEWHSERVNFDYGIIDENLDIKDISFLWQEELQKAYNKAKLDAAIEFNRCPTCGTWVCNDCFYVTHGELTDYCLNCIGLAEEACLVKEVKNEVI